MGSAARLDIDLSIPRDAAPGPGWSAQMLEMAEHIGAYDTLRVCEMFGGQELYVPADPAKSPFLPLLGAAKAKKLAWVYRRERLAIPTARAALARARRAHVMASVRAGELTVTAAAKVLGIRRDYLSKLVNHSDEGCGHRSIAAMKRKDDRQLDMFE